MKPNRLLNISVVAFLSFVIGSCNNYKHSEPKHTPSSLPDTISTWTAGIVHDSTRTPSDTFAVVKEVRAARHADYDRIVFEFFGPNVPGFHIEYVDEPVRDCGSGKPFYLPGDGWLMIKFLSARMHKNGRSTVERRDFESNLPNLLRLTTICDFENYVTWIASVETPNKFQVLALNKPSRLVVDIKH